MAVSLTLAVLLAVDFLPRAIADDPLIESAQLTAFDGLAQDFLGYDVAIDDDTVIVGAPLVDGKSLTTIGAAYVFIRVGNNWTLQQKLFAGIPLRLAQFGFSVAIEGNTALVGSRGENFNEGAAYVFVRSGSTWTQQQRLVAPDGLDGDRFGEVVALSGETAVVGAPYDDPGGVSRSGSAYVFVRSGTTWTFEQKLDASNGAANEGFPFSLSISDDTVIAGVQASAQVATNAGAAYIFVRSGVTWNEQQILTAGDAADGDLFGHSVAIDGDTALIGAYFDSEEFSQQGSAYEFVRSGTTWAERTKLKAGDASSQDRFGSSVALSGDLAVIGAQGLDATPEAISSGGAYVFQRVGGSWVQKFKLLPIAPGAADVFGSAVALSDDRTVIGAYQDDDNGSSSGSAFIYRLANEFCYGLTCPCGNEDAQAGCRNSTGKGGKLEAPLQSSIASSSLVLSASDLAPFNLGLVVATNAALPMPAQVGDGSLCIGGSSVYRFAPSVIAADGTLVVPNAYATAPPGFFVAGEFRYFQAWSRDVFCTPLPVPCASPCGGGSNVTNAVEVLFRP